MSIDREKQISKALNDLQKYKGENKLLPKIGSWPETMHFFEEKEIDAIKAAIAAERPLLIRGEPGTGKSQLARAVTYALKRSFFYEVIHAGSESQDLLYTYDAVERLAEAQVLSATLEEKTSKAIQESLAHQKYLCPGALWWTLDHESASKQHRCCRHESFIPELMAGCDFTNGAVLLIDEIDKADAELPNGLLEILGNGAFTVPLLNNLSVCAKSELPPPLVIITTNEERELPSAFVRRCLMLQLELKKGKDLENWLVERGSVHFNDHCSEAVRREAAKQLIKDRETAKESGLPAPGQAEYLDLLRILTRMGQDAPTQLSCLERIKGFVLKKNPQG